MSDGYLEQACKSSGQAGFSPVGDATQPVQACPHEQAKSRYAPCDAESLEIRSHTEEDEKFVQVVRCTLPARRDYSLNAEQRALLAGDDLLLQTVADYHHDGSYDTEDLMDDPEDLMEALITLTADVHPHCPADLHKGILWVVPDQPLCRFPVKSSNVPIPMLAKSTRLVFSWGEKAETVKSLTWLKSVKSFFKAPTFKPAPAVLGATVTFLARYWPFDKGRRVIGHAVVDSCGVRTGRQPNHRLRGRVEIWPNDKLELIFKIPPFSKFSAEGASYRVMTTGDKVESGSLSTSGAFGRKSEDVAWSDTVDKAGAREEMATKTTTSGGVTKSSIYEAKAGEVTIKQSRSTSKGLMTEKVTVTDGPEEEYPDRWDVEDSLSHQVSLKRNGVELDITKSVNSLISAAQSFRTAFDNFQKAVPKIGWQWDLDISIFEGSVTGTWGVVPEAHAEHARIWKVKQFYSICFEVKLVDVKVKLGWGLDFRIENWFASDPLLEIKAMMEGTFALEVPFSETFSSDNRAIYEREISAAAETKLQAVGRAAAAGYAFGASVAVSAGFKLTGSVKVGWETPPAFDGKAEWALIEVICRHEYPGQSKPWVKPVFRWADKPVPSIWEGTLPNLPSES